MRWAIERTKRWLSYVGQLRRSTERRPRPPAALAITLVLTAKPIDWAQPMDR